MSSCPNLEPKPQRHVCSTAGEGPPADGDALGVSGSEVCSGFACVTGDVD